MAFERGDYEAAVAGRLASFERREGSAATLDGPNLSPVDTAKRLLERLKEEKREELASQLDGVLKRLDPELLRMPA